MDGNWVRCRRCHEVFEVAEVCPRCGAPYQPRTAQPQESVDSFAERYAGTEFAPPEPPPPPFVVPGSRNPTPFIVGGAALVVFAILVAAVTGAWNGPPPPTVPPVIVVGTVKPTATPSPLPVSVVATIAQLSDPAFTAAITIQSRAAIDARVIGTSQYGTAVFKGYLSAADETGVYTLNASSREFTIFGGIAYSRAGAAATWALTSTMPTYLVLRPLFKLTKPEMLVLVGSETRDGVAVVHLRSTAYWIPEVNRMALMDLSGVGIKPDTFKLDLWTAPDGAPVSAEFSAETAASDGTKLIDVEATWSFSDVGIPHVMADPLATPSPSPSASSGPSQ